MHSVISEQQVISKRRVTDHGEVYTASREVNAMLDSVKRETENIDSRFLEPACGTGNFLAEVLARKLRVVEKRYRKSQLEFERSAVRAVGSIYGIDILEDNVVACCNRLFDLFNERYSDLFKKTAKDGYRKTIRYILEKNIVWGDARLLKTVGANPSPIVFSEWVLARGSFVKRTDYSFSAVLLPEKHDISDTGNDVFSPKQIRTYPLIHFLRLSDER